MIHDALTAAFPATATQVGLSTTAQFELAAFFLIGLLGGAHCLGMCGPLVTMYASRFGGDDDPVTFYELRQHLLFNGGRTVSYAALGGIFGLLGAVFYDAASVVLVVGDAVRGGVGLLVGVAILVTGLRYVIGGTDAHGLGLGLPFADRLARPFGALQSRLDGLARGPGIVGLGVVHGLLPCPLLYPAYLYAFARGSPTTGVLTLGVLGLGTVPALFVYGTVLNSVGATGRVRLHRALGVAFLVLASLPLTHGLSLLGVPVPHVMPPIYQPLTG